MTRHPASYSTSLVRFVTTLVLALGIAAFLPAGFGGDIGSGSLGTNAASAQAGRVVKLWPGADYQRVVWRNPPGTTFEFQPGVHRRVRIVPRPRQSFTAAQLGTVTLDGEGQKLPAFRSMFRRGRWVRSGVTIENLVFTGYAPNVYYGIIDAASEDYPKNGPGWRPNSNWTIRNLIFRDNPGTGDSAAITVGSGTVVDNVVIENHPGVGIYGHGHHIRIEDSVIRNTSTKSNIFWHSGGIKLVTVHNTIVRRNIVENSAGPGIWFDVNSDRTWIVRNKVRNNALAGIFYEVSRRAVIDGNTVVGNGFGDSRGWLFPGGITLSTSHDSVVRANVLRQNAAGITAIDQRTARIADRSVLPGFGQLYDRDGSVAAWRGENNRISNNTIANSGVSGASAAAGESVGSTLYATTEFVSNTWIGSNERWWGTGSNYGSPFAPASWRSVHPND